MSNTVDRRRFLAGLAHMTGAVVLLPEVTACGPAQPAEVPAPASPPVEGAAEPEPTSSAPLEVPLERPADWDPIAFNRDRGNAGAIPASYREAINGPEGENKHLGKHLPFLPEVDASLVPEGYLALMWGDPSKGHARHPNAVRSDANNQEGHWYDWIEVRKATGEAEALKSSYSDWPAVTADDNGQYVAADGGDVTADGGRNTVYLVALPADVAPGDTIRIWAHCLTHGEYVDFLSVP